MVRVCSWLGTPIQNLLNEKSSTFIPKYKFCNSKLDKKNVSVSKTIETWITL